jgi:hypothetical protein
VSSEQNGVEHLWHYLDDFFFTCGEPGTVEYQPNLQKMTSICESWGFLLALKKVKGPATSLILLDILINTIDQDLRLPVDKLSGWKRNAVLSCYHLF